MATILCVDDEPPSLLILEAVLQRARHRTISVRNVDAALTVLMRGGIDLIISDYLMPDRSGMDLLDEVRTRKYDVPVIMVTGHASIEHAVTAIKAGALDYITKPLRPEQLELAVEHALRFLSLRNENARLREEVGRYRSSHEIVGESLALQRVMETLRVVAPTRATVLLEGESGTGKELLARALHDQSDRSGGPFISVNCAAIPEHLVESTLFGHEKGAFTGAVKQNKGAFERADGGTLLLDEVTEMRLDLQAKLLRVLQEQEFERVGGSDTVRVDVRVVATTNRDLARTVKEGGFREDLFYRLTVVPLRVPPLRERREDIPLLAQHFARRTAEQIGKPFRGLSPETVDRLQAYDWPGNIRELGHAIERAVILTTTETLEPAAFEWARFGLAPGSGAAGPGGRGGFGDAAGSGDAGGAASGGANGDSLLPIQLHSLDLNEAERVLIDRALRATGQNRTRAAELLGIHVRTLRNKLNQPTRPEARGSA